MDQSGLDPILKALGKEVNRKVKDAGLRRVHGHIVATSASHEGRTLNAAGMKAAVISEIAARQARRCGIAAGGRRQGHAPRS